MILPCLFIAPSKSRGRGVFTAEELPKNEIIEIAPVIVMPAEAREHLDKTLLHDYIFEWGHEQKEYCMALGYVPIYNHSYLSNCDYDMDYDAALIKIITMRKIKAGEELFINYNGEFNDPKPMWFDVT